MMPYAGGCLGVLCFSAHEPTCLVIGPVESTQVLNGQGDLGDKHYLGMFKSSCPGFAYKFRYLVTDSGGSLHIPMDYLGMSSLSLDPATNAENS